MDDGTLRALRAYTNFGYSLGLCPYKFCQVNHNREQRKQKQINSHNWFGDDENKQVEEEKEVDKNTSAETEEESERKSNGILHTLLIKCRKRRKVEGQDQKFGDKKIPLENWNWSFKSGSKSRWWLLIFSMILQLLYQSFLIFQSTHLILNEQEITRETFQIFYLTGTLVIFNYYSWVILSQFDQLANYLNAVKDTVTSIGVQQAADDNSKTKQRSIKSFIYAQMTLNFLVFLVRALSPFRQPSSKLIVTSLAENPEQLPIWIKALAALFHFHVSCFSAFVGGISVVTLLWYVAAVLPLMESTKLTEKGVSLDPNFLYSSYYRLTVLQNNFKVAYGEVTLTSEIAVIFIISVNFFFAVVHEEIPGLLRALILSYLSREFFSKLGRIHTVSAEAIDSWKMKLRRGGAKGGGAVQAKEQFLWFEKFLMSTRPLRMYVGEFFYVDKTFVLTLMGIIINMTTNLILSTK